MSLQKSSNRATKEPSGFEFAIAGKLDFLNVDHWDSVTAGASLFLSRRYLKVAQDDFKDSIIRDFALIYDAGQPVAAVATQAFDVIGDQLVADNANGKKRVSDGLKKKTLALLKRRVLMCGNVHTWGPHGVAFRQDQDPEKLWKGVADCLYRIRRANRLHGQTDYVIVKDIFSDQQIAAGQLQPYRYRSMETEPNMVLTLDPDWNTLDDYFGSLTKRYRAAGRKVVKPFNNGNLSVSRMQDIGAHSQRIHHLYKSVASKADVCLFNLEETTLPRLADALGDDFATIVIRDEETLIGFVTVVRDGETAVGYYIGIDYTANESLPIYHRLLIAVIEQAIEWRCKDISFGRTALDAKSRLGCKPEETNIWVRHRVPVLNAIVQQVLKNVNHAEPPERNPFKEA